MSVLRLAVYYLDNYVMNISLHHLDRCKSMP